MKLMPLPQRNELAARLLSDVQTCDIVRCLSSTLAQSEATWVAWTAKSTRGMTKSNPCNALGLRGIPHASARPTESYIFVNECLNYSSFRSYSRIVDSAAEVLIPTRTDDSF
jgi:hypothetical protein